MTNWTTTMIVAMTLACLSLQSFAGDLPTPQVPSLPTDDSYVQVRDGHLELSKKRVRYWAWMGHFACDGDNAKYNVKPSDSQGDRFVKIIKQREIYSALAQRIHDLGFNCVRYWTSGNWVDQNYTPGDGSSADQMAFSLAELDKLGIKVWFTGFNDLGSLTAADASLADDPGTAETWIRAVGELKSKALRSARQCAWDPRTKAAMLNRMKYIAEWPNKYKSGLRLGDDPQIAVWELQNEEWWFLAMTSGEWQTLPKFFRDTLQQQWADFLKKKYGTDDALREAWQFLLPGEALESHSIVLAPIGSGVSSAAVNDANPQALSILKGAGTQTLTRDDFTRRRGEDVLEFLLQMQITYKTDVRDRVRSWGKSLQLCPIVLDTGNGYQIQAVYLQQQGDAVAMCSYMWQTAIDRQQPRFPFVSGLEEPPRLAMGIPWVEVGRVPGKPFFVYEFQTSNPDKYRAEMPLRVGALGAIQDWDIVGWHLFGRPNDPAKPEPYTAPMSMSHSGKGGPVEGIHFKNDLVESATMRTAGRIFIDGLLRPAAKPTLITFGRKSLYDPKSSSYGGSFGDKGVLLAPTAHRYGLQMVVDPKREDDAIDGPTVTRGLMEACPVRPTPEIEYDWRKGHLIFDAPAAVSYTGFYANHGGPVRLADGQIILDHVTVRNEEGVNYPVTSSELYLSFVLASLDGQPIYKARQITMSLVSTSFNFGMKLDEDKVARGDLGYTGKPFENLIGGGDASDRPPVAYCIPAATLTAPALAGMRYRLLDFHFRELGSGVVGADGVVSIGDDRPIFAINFIRP